MDWTTIIINNLAMLYSHVIWPTTTITTIKKNHFQHTIGKFKSIAVLMYNSLDNENKKCVANSMTNKKENSRKSFVSLLRDFASILFWLLVALAKLIILVSLLKLLFEMFS